jgi:hypothetical protein
MRLLGMMGLIALIGLTGCKKGDEAGKPGEPAAKSGGAELDPKAELQALQGTWKVKDAFNGASTWVVAGDKVTRTQGETSKAGKLEFPAPGQIAVAVEEGGGSSREYYGYARNGADLYLGLGKAGVKLGDTFKLAADEGLVIKDAQSCKFFKKSMFEGYEKNGVAVKCELKKDPAGKEVFAYETPDPFKGGQLSPHDAFVVGTALLDEQMLGNKVERAQ